jgi:hypothetical protein
MTRLMLDARAEPLIAPLRALIDGALARLPDVGAVVVDLGERGWITPASAADPAAPAAGGGLRPARIALPSALLSGDVQGPDERDSAYALDRWRRAAACVLEGVALLGLGADGAPDADWRALAIAQHAADAACPELALAAADLAAAPGSLGPGSDPRVGVAIAAAIAAGGGDPWAEIGAWIAGEPPSPARWLALVGWVLGAGLAARVGGPVDAAPGRDIPLDLPAWSWARIDVPAHPRGGLVAVEGGACVAAPWAVGGERLRTLAGALAAPGRLSPHVGFPVGAWECVSARGFGQVFGVRGMTWVFKGDGRLELVLADAFAGSFDAVEMAEQVGTSGVVPGRWRVAGPSRVAVSRLDTTGIAMHGRGDQPFAVPAMGMGMGQVIQAMSDGDWAWERAGEELYLRGAVMGGSVEMRLRSGRG